MHTGTIQFVKYGLVGVVNTAVTFCSFMGVCSLICFLQLMVSIPHRKVNDFFLVLHFKRQYDNMKVQKYFVVINAPRESACKTVTCGRFSFLK